jgi:uncharacterized membrane protein YphA (DoxX/SURF4 family)
MICAMDRPAALEPRNAPERALARLAAVDPTVVLRLFLGAVFITVFFENLAFKRYTPDGYERLIDRYASRNDAPAFWSDGVMQLFADNATVFAPLQAITELSFGLLLVLGLASGLVALAITGFLVTLWFSELGLFWIWELLGLVMVALAVALGSLPSLLRGSTADRILGPPSLPRWPLVARLALAVVGGLALAVLIDASGTGGRDNGDVSLRAGLVFGGALVALALLDDVRRRRGTGAGA